MALTGLSEFNASIYYANSFWHSLLQDCIKPLKKHLAVESKLSFFLVFLGTYKGDHIRIYFHLRGSIIIPYLQQSEERITKFLTRNPSRIKKDDVPIALFMNIPNNTIIKASQENGTAAKFATKSHFLSIHEYISKVILEVLSLEKLDFDAIFSFSLHLHLIATKILSRRIASKKKQLFQNLTQICISSKIMGLNSSDLSDDYILGSFFSDNKDMLLEIIRDTWSGKRNYLNWLSEAEYVFESEFEKRGRPTITCCHLFNIINEHLGLANQQSLMMMQLLDKVVNQRRWM